MAATLDSLTEEVQDALEHVRNKPAEWDQSVANAISALNNAVGTGSVTYYVDQTYTGVSNGTQAAPFASIHDAMTASRKFMKVTVRVVGHYKTRRLEDFRAHRDVTLIFDHGATLEFGRARVEYGGDISTSEANDAAYGRGWGLFGFVNVGNLAIFLRHGNVLIPRCYSDGDDTLFSDYWNTLLSSVAIRFSGNLIHQKTGIHLNGGNNYGALVSFIEQDGSISEPGLALFCGGQWGDRQYRAIDGQMSVHSQDWVWRYLHDDGAGLAEKTTAEPIQGEVVPTWFGVGHHNHGLQRNLDALHPVVRIGE